MSNASSSSAESSSEPEARRSAPSPEIPLATLTALAHELRNALGPVRTATYLLRASTGADAQALWALDLIDRQAQAMASAIDALTDLLRLARGTLELAGEPVDLGDALDAAAAACTAELAEKRQSAEWERPAVRVPLSGDRARLVQSFATLVRTASNAAPAGSRIAIALSRKGLEANIAIGALDEPGSAALAPSESAVQQAPGSANLPGSAHLSANVALMLARGIVERHGGDVTASGRSRFDVRLPLAD